MLPPKIMDLIWHMEKGLEAVKNINNEIAKTLMQGKQNKMKDVHKSAVCFVQAVLQKKDLISNITLKVIEILVPGVQNKKQFTKTLKNVLKGNFGWIITDYLDAYFNGRKFCLNNLYIPLDKKILGEFWILFHQ